MNETIDFLHLTAKLPGYLFVLANLTIPGDTVYLNCSQDKRAFISLMLSQIGLNVQSSLQFQDEQTQKPIILSVCEGLQDISQIKSNDAINILLLPYQFPIKQFKNYAMGVISKYTDHIIIDELLDLVDSKIFFVALSKDSHYYVQLKQKIVCFKLN